MGMSKADPRSRAARSKPTARSKPAAATVDPTPGTSVTARPGADLGIVGLGVMGRSLALNIADRGFTLAAADRSTAALDRLAQDNAAIAVTADLAALPALLARPRAILLMVNAGAPVDAVLDQLLPLLDAGDVVIDGGNSHWRDTRRRAIAARPRGVMFCGFGISGGEAGARHGPSIMAGGETAAFVRVAPIFQAIAARHGDRACLAHFGGDGAGHFVKMVHNGIEYADMQMIAEVVHLLRHGLGVAPAELAARFRRWNEGALQSYLTEITADILARSDADTGRPVLDVILDRAGQKGTGQWASEAALELGVPAPTIMEAVAARALSALKEERVAAATRAADRPRPIDAGAASALVEDAAAALQGGRIAAYAQGLALIEAAARSHGWHIDPGEVGAVWQGGCIIRARLLDDVRAAYADEARPANLMLADGPRLRLAEALPGWRRVVGAAIAHGWPVPGLTSALAYHDGYRSPRLWADVIQAQRDYFGAHGIERVDRAGSFHIDWTTVRSKPR
jgi:6-phosphogluconate dehydrogenase